MKNIERTQNYLIAKIIPKETKTSSGILIPEMAKQISPLSEATVIATGPGYYGPDGNIIPMKIKVGDSITFLMTSGLVVEAGPEGEYKMFKEEEILGLIKWLIDY